MGIVIRLLVAGIMIGTLYGLVAVTLTLMLRSTGILSFAHAGFALVAAYVYNDQVCPQDPTFTRPCADPRLSPGAASVLAVVVAVVAALLVERFIARPLAHASAAIKVIGTAAALGLMTGLLLQIYGAQPRATPPTAARQILPRGTFEVLGVVINKPHFSIFVISVVLVSLFGILLRRSWLGLGVRAAGQLPDVSRLMGVSPVAVSRFNWGLSGLLAGLAGVLIGPVTIVNAGTFSFLLVKAVGATLIGGLVSLPLTFVGGIGIGAVEALAPHFWKTPGAAAVAVGALIFVMLRVHGKRFALLGYAGTSQNARASGPLAASLATWLNVIRRLTQRLPRPVWALLAIPVLLFPFRNAYDASIGVSTLYYALVALSILIFTGSTGQVTFMQAGFAAIGAFGLATAQHAGWNLLLGLVTSVAACVVVGILVGMSSLRFRGLEFAIASLAVSAVLSEFVVTRPGINSNLSNPELFGRNLLDTKNVYGLMLVCTAVAFLLVANVRRSYWARTLAAMREMHTRVGHFGIAPVRSEVAFVAMSAGIAGLAGAFLALTIVSLDPISFVPLISVTMVLTAVVGGLRSLWGPVLAGLVFGVGQEVVGRVFSRQSANAFPQIAGATLAILLILGMPNGLASLFAWAREVAGRTPDRARVVMFRGAPLAALPLAPAPNGNGNGNGSANGQAPRRLILADGVVHNTRLVQNDGRSGARLRRRPEGARPAAGRPGSDVGER